MWQRNTQYEETELDKLFLQDMMEKAANERQEKNQKVLKFDNPMMLNLFPRNSINSINPRNQDSFLFAHLIPREQG